MKSPLNTFIEFQKKLLQINENNFDEIAWELFHFQAANNEVYGTYLKYLKINIKAISSLEEIPFLPIRFFKSHAVKTGLWPSQCIYQSSGTTESVRSYHHLWDESHYLHHTATTFEKFFGSLQQHRILALLPSYDTGHSSLVAMARYFISKSEVPGSGFFLNDFKKLTDVMEGSRNSSEKTLLLGVSHALLDLVDQGPFALDNLIVIETGGMKGRKVEITRQELHEKLQKGLGVQRVCSEYGMTELCSQAYATKNGVFRESPAMRVIIKEISDPFSVAKSSGIINVIDLANYHSCAFVETQDLGRVTQNGFEVLGRADNSEARGCNLMIA